MANEEFTTEEFTAENADCVKEDVENTQTADTTEQTAETTDEVHEANEADGTTEDDTDSKDSKKDKKKKEKVDKKDEQIKDLNDKLLRQMAEFQNYRNRTEKEKSSMFDAGCKAAAEKLLPIVDNFERGLVGVEEGEDPFKDGMLLTYKQIISSLTELGVTPIEALGNEFNADLHEAIQHIEDDTHGENEIVQELRKGYMYKDTVLRHSLVIVAN